MSDERLRQLERRLEGGAPDEARRLLRAYERRGLAADALRLRVAVGELSEERLELLAFVGHEPARAALGRELGGVRRRFPKPWVNALVRRFGHAQGVRVSLLAARRVQREVGLEPRQRDQVEEALSAGEAWLRCPCRAHYRQAEGFNGSYGWLPEWAYEAVTAAHCAGHHHEASALRSALHCIPEEALRRAIEEGVRTWVLATPSTYGDLWPLVHRGDLSRAQLRRLREVHDRLAASSSEIWDVPVTQPDDYVWGGPLGALVEALGEGDARPVRRRRARLALLAADRAVVRGWRRRLPKGAPEPPRAALAEWLGAAAGDEPPEAPTFAVPSDTVEVLARVAQSVRAAYGSALPGGALAAVDALHQAWCAHDVVGEADAFQRWLIAEAVPTALLGRPPRCRSRLPPDPPNPGWPRC